MTTATVPIQITLADIAEAERIWHEYQQTHGLTGLRGHAAGIDPKTGEVWLGKTAVEICLQREALGLSSLLFFVHIGFSTYLRKLGRLRCSKVSSRTMVLRSMSSHWEGACVHSSSIRVSTDAWSFPKSSMIRFPKSQWGRRDLNWRRDMSLMKSRF